MLLDYHEIAWDAGAERTHTQNWQIKLSSSSRLEINCTLLDDSQGISAIKYKMDFIMLPTLTSAAISTHNWASPGAEKSIVI